MSAPADPAGSDPTPAATPGVDSGAAARRPLPLAVAVLTVLLESAVLVVLGVAELASLDSQRLAMGLSTAAFFLGYGALLAVCARSAWRGEAWPRSIVVMGQLIQLGTAWSNRDANPTLAALAAMAALVVLVGVFHPASLRALEDA
ncbi:hypothetical protein IEQ44_02885 [Nocardioides sp. Y6]|uniref:Integral membrane protein n=1 Tax=Nocardioides malaquae TaxID=2773426 RepID=A0ABR9RQY2_9ACTN|nr:hypothetical protein [Nocardioides malaquae]MBE7323597.1 hypothetical protein [Nocardioides malaquae]